jgi:hypothetical protein
MSRSRVVTVSSVALVGALLAGCARGQLTSGAGPIALADTRTDGKPGEAPPPAPSPPPSDPMPAASPAPAPAPAPLPPPAPATVVPPLSPVLVDLNNNHRVGIPHWPEGDTAAGAHGEVVDGLECFPGEHPSQNYHVHSHLSIFLDGVALSVPEDIGVVKLTPTTECSYTLHTHDHSGKIHIEAAAPGTFRLGTFFDIWGEPLEPDNVAGLTGKPIVIYVTDNNGVVTEATGSWKDIELISHREITIQVGTPVEAIPNFTWRAN